MARIEIVPPTDLTGYVEVNVGDNIGYVFGADFLCDGDAIYEALEAETITRIEFMDDRVRFYFGSD